MFVFITDGVVWTVVTLSQSTCIVPDWTDENTRLQVYGLLQIHPPRGIVQIREFPWFGTFVQGLCEMYGMGNPLDEDDYSDEDGQDDETDDEEEEYMRIGEDHESLLRKFLRNLRWVLSCACKKGTFINQSFRLQDPTGRL